MQNNGPTNTGPTAANPTIVDLSQIKNSLQGNIPILRKLVDHFLNTYPQQLLDLQTAVIDQNAEALLEKAHAFKGTLLNFGAQKAVAHAYALEQMGAAAKLDDAEKILTELNTDLLEIRAFFSRPDWAD